MPSQQTTPLAGTAEVEAALADAHAAAGALPNLDDGSGETFVPVPVHAFPPTPKPAWLRPAQDPPSRSAPEARPPRDADPAPAAKAKPDRDPQQSQLALGRVVYRLVDGVLSLLNRPFDWLSPPARQLTGWLAIVTIVTSLLVWCLLPRFFPSSGLFAQPSPQSAAR